MQKDMHYYAIYFLCLAAGLSLKHAYQVAYSSQYVDDSKYGHPISLKNKDGSIKEFEPIRTAHNGFESMGEGVQEKVYFPFHFLPGMDTKTNNYEEMVVTKAGNKGSLFQTVINEVLASNDYFSIGISLHVLADTFSHENFSGLWSIFNNIRKVNFVPTKKGPFSALGSKIWWKLRKNVFNLAPAIGHGRAGTFPDIPFMCWSYYRFSNDYRMVSNNLKFFNGMLLLYENLISNIPKESNTRIDMEELRNILWEGVFKGGRKNKRCKFWRKKIKKILRTKQLEIRTEHLKYKPKRWQKEVSKLKKFLFFQPTKIILKVSESDFLKSNFYQFHKQALKHRIFILETLKKEFSSYKKINYEEFYIKNNIEKTLEKTKKKVLTKE